MRRSDPTTPAIGAHPWERDAAALGAAAARMEAGPRFPGLEPHEVIGDRRAAARLAAPVEAVLDSSYVLTGMPGEIADRLRDHHARFGIRRWAVFGDRPDLQPAEQFVPALDLLSGG